MDTESGIHIRLADAGDDDFILSLVDRFVDFDLPRWRRRGETAEGIRRDIARHLREQPGGSHLFVAEDDDGDRVGFLHLQITTDFFTGGSNCHISDLVTAPSHDGKGVGSALIAYAERFARDHHCRFVTLAVFEGNKRARELYERRGFGTEILRMAKPVK
ncbi:GNAT family N-acetyltransferase [Tahibacter amnicola]|uniref:GNAT family N-acetyltransferase n=1 Tax=Tahibacter amnicola TaxID=2976241 RepID=A0ABY6BHP5_9GAMM|nr:GNAT family N-acetyltransferase [Tahibacter amnicola]UXI69404.1 GNAT family N-acetyltransferase [Tahibacter amnicola]